jgi:hypothetical protein
MGGTCSSYGGERVAYRVLVVKYERKRPLESPRLRCENDIKIDL